MRNAALFLLLLCVGCSRERARALPAAAEESAAHGKYQDMLAHARDRQTAEQDMMTLEAARSRFLHDAGRLPSNLVELVGRYLTELPAPPDGMRYAYDAVNGNIELVSQPDPANPATPGPPAAP